MSLTFVSDSTVSFDDIIFRWECRNSTFPETFNKCGIPFEKYRSGGINITYQNDLNCTWTFSPICSIVTWEIANFDIENNPNCENDYISINGKVSIF